MWGLMINNFLQAILRSFLNLSQHLWDILLLKQDHFPLKDWVLSAGPEHSSCIYKCKSDVATYREKAPHVSYGEKMWLYLKKNVCFPEATRSFKKEWLLFFPWLCYFSNEDAPYCLPCVLFGHNFPTKTSRVKVYFHSPLGIVSYFTNHCESKIEKIKFILHMNMFKYFIFQHGLNLNIFSQIKGPSSWN